MADFLKPDGGMVARSDLETQSSSAHSCFQVLGVSRDILRAGHL